MKPISSKKHIELDEFIKKLKDIHEESEIKTLILLLNDYLIRNNEFLHKILDKNNSLDNLLTGLNTAMAQEYKMLLQKIWSDSLEKHGYSLSNDFKILDKDLNLLYEIDPEEEYLKLIFKSRLGLEYQSIDQFYLSLRNSVWKQLRTSLRTMNTILQFK